MHVLSIILLCVAAAIFYGIVQDNVTARICVEYFSVFHPHVVDSTSPTVLAFVWGILATWWVGLGLGIPLAIASRVGRWPKLRARELVRPLCILLAIISIGSAGAGILGWRSGAKLPRDPGTVFSVMRGVLLPERYSNFWADLAAHQAAYAIGAVGGIGLCGWAIIRRWRLSRKHTASSE